MKKFVYQFIILTSLIFLSIITYNYYTDIYGILRGDFSKPRPTEPNQHFVKIQYLINNPNKYDAYCFGSSRVGNIDLTNIKNGYKYYNMTYSAGLPHEWLNDIKILINHQVKIKQVLLGIDDFSFKINPATHYYDLLRIPYQENNLKTYIAFLFKKPSKPLFLLDESKSSFFDIYNSGRPLHPQADIEIENNINAHVNNPKFNIPTAYKGNYIDGTINDIRKIKEITDKNNIELIIFINPIHKTTYLSNDLNEFNEFKRKLSTISNFYDFSGLNEITTNNYYYYETSHYRPLVGNMIINRIFNMPTNLNTNFGIYVTPKNIENHIKFLENQIKNK